MRSLFWLLIICLFFVLGCVQQGEVIGGVNDGIRVNSFVFDSSTITDKELVELTFDIENVGAYDADDVNFYLYGFDEDVWVSESVETSIGVGTGDSWTITGFKGYDMDLKSQGFDGGYYQLFSVTPDRISKGVTKRYSFNGRLCYDYEVRAIATLEAISAVQKREEKNEGVFSSSSVSVVNSYGPIQIDVKTKSPLVFYSSSAGQEAELALLIRNLGGGFPSSNTCSLDIGVGDINQLKSLDVTLDGVALTCDTTYTFYDGQATVYCTYIATNPRPKAEYALSVIAKYNYYLDVRTSIDVIGSSDDVEFVPFTGGDGFDGAGAVLDWGTCEDVCKTVGVTMPLRPDLGSLAVCSDNQFTDYPDTNVGVQLCALGDGDCNLASVVPDWSDSSAYLVDLSLHDVTVKDIGLKDLILGTLDGLDISLQYTEKTFFVDSDRDGLPDEWEDFHLSLKKDNADSDGDGVKDGNELCGSNACKSNGDCNQEETYKVNYYGDCYKQEYNDKLNLGIVDAVGGEFKTLSQMSALVTTPSNSVPHIMADGEIVDGMKIVSIGGKTVQEITGESTNSKVRAITAIDVGKINLVKLVSGSDAVDLVKSTECKYSMSYADDIVCGCVVDLEAMGPVLYDDGRVDARKRIGYPPLVTASTSRCNTKCGNLGYDGGVCINNDVVSTFNGNSDYRKRCKGSQFVSYTMDISDGDSDGKNYDCSDFCYCYRVDDTLTTMERKLMCTSD